MIRVTLENYIPGSGYIPVTRTVTGMLFVILCFRTDLYVQIREVLVHAFLEGKIYTITFEKIGMEWNILNIKN